MKPEIKTKKAPQGVKVYYAEPDPKIDLSKIEPYGKQDGWTLIKREFLETRTGTDGAVSEPEWYCYAQCECGDYWLLAADKLSSMKDCGCGGGVKARKSSFGAVPKTTELAARSEPRTESREGFEVMQAGRPKMYGQEKAQVASFTIPASVLEWLEKTYWETRASKSAIVTQAIREYIQRVEEAKEKS